MEVAYIPTYQILRHYRNICHALLFYAWSCASCYTIKDILRTNWQDGPQASVLACMYGASMYTVTEKLESVVVKIKPTRPFCILKSGAVEPHDHEYVISSVITQRQYNR